MKKTKETWVQSLGGEDLLEKEIATHSSILAWKIPWTEEPDGLQFMWSQRAGHDGGTQHAHTMLLWSLSVIHTQSVQFSRSVISNSL